MKKEWIENIGIAWLVVMMTGFLFLVTNSALAAELNVYEVDSLKFSTTDQSMWNTGDGVAPKSETYSTSWHDVGSIGGITGSAQELVPGTGITVPNPARPIYDAAMSTCRGLGFSKSQCEDGVKDKTICDPFGILGCTTVKGVKGLGSRPSATIDIPAEYIDTRTGSESTFTSKGSLSFTNSFGANGGTVDAEYEFDASLSFPTQVHAGVFFNLNPQSNVRDGELVTKFPTLTGKMNAGMHVDIDVKTESCFLLAGCDSNTDPIIDIHFDPDLFRMNTITEPSDSAVLFGLDDFPFKTTVATVHADYSVIPTPGIYLSLPFFPKPPVAINLADLKLDAPASDLTQTGNLHGDGSVSSKSEFDDIISLDVDLDGLATATGHLAPLGSVTNIGPITIRGDILDMGLGPTVDLSQDFEMTQELWVKLSFSSPILARNYGGPGDHLVDEIEAPFRALPYIALPDNVPVTVTPTFFVKAELDNETKFIYDISFFRKFFNSEITLVGFITLLNTCDNASPLVGCSTEPLAELAESELFNDKFALEGFNEETTAPFVLVTNRPPELVNVPDDIIVEGDTIGGADKLNSAIAAFINQVSATDTEDDDSTLVVNSTPELPNVLAVESTTVVTFSVTDSFGDSDTAQASITIVDTTPPVLALDDLTVVAQGPLGTPIPDSAMTVSNWLEDLVFIDIVDPSPNLESAVPLFLDLGINNLGFIATDASGNQTSINPVVDVKAAFSLFAENSLRIDKRTDIGSGIVVVPDAGSGLWLSEEAQVTVDKFAAISSAAPVYSDEIFADQSAVVGSAFVNYTSGKGSVTTDGSFESGIYFPLDALPEFSAGTETLILGCTDDSSLPSAADCSLSEMHLADGDYGDLIVHSNDGSTPNTIYLTGGVYSFASVSLDKDTRLLAQASTMILIADGLNAGDNSMLGPDFEYDGVGTGLVVMVAGQDQLVGAFKNKKAVANQKNLKIQEYAVDIGENGSVEATVFVPDGSVRIGKGSEVSGALIGENLDIGQEVIVRYDGDI